MRIILLSLVIILLSGCTDKKSDFEGPFSVSRVIDGDTLVLRDSQKIRLSGINAPEKGECYYEEASKRLESLVLEGDIFLEMDKTDTDKYRRELRYVYREGALINLMMVSEGYAVAFDKYKNDTKRYDELKRAEETARQQNLGLWQCKKEECAYISSKNSKIYHKAGCKWAKRILPENKVCYKSVKDIPKNLKLSNCPT